MAIIDVVKFDGLKSRDWIIYKHPSENLVFGTQLVVGEGQAAIFVKGGAVCDAFHAGTHTLNAQNLPILQRMVNLPFGGRTPFTAEIYYINLALKLDVNWGTTNPIQLIDPKYFVKLRIRAFGQLGLKIADYRQFFTEVVGTMQMADVVKFDKVLAYYKGIIVTKIKTIIADVIINQKISALEISAKLDDISGRVLELVRPEIAKFGFSLVNFFVQSINFPDEDFEQVNKVLESKAAFEIMGDNRYVTQRSFDVYETAAGNDSGVAGAFVAGGVGLGAGAAIAASVQQNVQAPAQGVKCSGCGATNEPGVKFCPACGMPSQPKKIACPGCSAQVAETARFCPECGTSLAEKTCVCGARNPVTAKFCPECGRKDGDAQ